MKSVIDSLNSKYKSGAAHTFLFYLNTNDGFLDFSTEPPRSLPLVDYLNNNSFVSESSFVIAFNVTSGLRLVSNITETDFCKSVAGALMGDKDEDRAHMAVELGKEFGKGENIEERIVAAQRFLSLALKAKRKKCDSRKPMIVLFFEYLDIVCPRNSSSSDQDKNRLALEMILSLARNPDIREAGNAIILVSESLGSVAEQLNSETNSIVPIKVPFPSLEERERLFVCMGNGKVNDTKLFARNSAGMSSNMIAGFIAESLHSGGFSLDVLFDKKKKFVDEQSRGLLEVHRPFDGIEVIGALEEHKRYILEDVVANMRAGRLLAVASGILLVGAQGTGKTVFVEATAHEAGLIFLSLKNIREMWVGQSERNLEFALELIMAQSPVVVFMDEIDQEMQSRSSVGTGDNTGVNQRIQGRLFRFMSDTGLRGQVLWIAATNRPDLLDPALLREGRFDKKVPFFPPSSSERAPIVKALLVKNQLRARRLGIILEIELTEEEIAKFARRAHCHMVSAEDEYGQKTVELIKCDWDRDHQFSDKEDDDEVYFTGGQMEAIIADGISRSEKEGVPFGAKHLFESLDDYLPPMEMVSYQAMTELAMRAANSARFFPKEGKWFRVAKRLKLITSPKNSQNENTRIKFTKDNPQ